MTNFETKTKTSNKNTFRLEIGFAKGEKNFREFSMFFGIVSTENFFYEFFVKCFSMENFSFVFGVYI